MTMARIVFLLTFIHQKQVGNWLRSFRLTKVL